ncbi:MULTISPECIES: nitrate- and nitrite sensing domain-containing protein [Actinoalloteichus]|uniref:histidine kinase n=1 Tax=Actinoalloteichus fjordicus TaxID=1612552 RepID=A0AAC9LES5_9PSEU|nr:MULTISPECIES: nitrate- and nitrite sensing domain-containing protein [Actinoalloteichus]APU16608.1 HAMP domain-containing protein,histidine kinase [Actinoalloteichus fjordicus]APU22674.1 HAMP domain-containing protein,histidine kinase [Actinoalloteichus sp. GBA129-24]
MTRIPTWLGRGRTIRSRVLTIALIPSIALLVLGFSAAGYLLVQGNSERQWSNLVEESIEPELRFITTLEEERRLSLLRLAGDDDFSSLERQRRQVDDVLTERPELEARLIRANPEAIGAASERYNESLEQLPAIRQGVDDGSLPQREAYAFYNQLIGISGLVLDGIAQTARAPEAASAKATAADLFDLLEGMSRSNALGVGGVASGGMSVLDSQEYRRQVDAYHVGIDQVLPTLTPEGRAAHSELLASEPWNRLTSVENAIIDRGAFATDPQDAGLPLNIDAWQESARTVSESLLDIWIGQHRHAQELASASSERTFVNSLIAGVVVLAAAIAAMLVAARMSNRLISRLHRLRDETLKSAEVRLPAVMERVRKGEEISPETDLPPTDPSSDEIGEVAEAFDSAQRAAVAAAVQEAKTRTGMNAVFLNIAHRSQVVVRRQLEVLDEAESRQEDPRHLELLFKLDHLATRARRNAENLVILGGERPGRRWRNPVPLDEIVRSAVSETEGYARVHALRLPDVPMEGSVVADLIHLLAELVDNATSFSPPDSRVEVRGNLVGKGVVVEVEDQGLGIPEEERERLNATLHDPPNFEVMTLSERMRLGLFVVAQLAHRHGVTVTLAESAYGGVHAIVLLPATLMAKRTDEKADQRGELPRRRVLPGGLPRQGLDQRPRYEPGDADTIVSPAAVVPAADAPGEAGTGDATTTREAAGDGEGGRARSASTPATDGTAAAPSAADEGAAVSGRPAESATRNGSASTKESGSPQASTDRPVPATSSAEQGEVSTAAVHWPEEDMSSEKPTPPSHSPTPRREEPGAALPVRKPSTGTPPSATDTRAPLPRRRRQRNLAPQLTGEIRSPGPAGPTDVRPARSPEEARAAMSAFVRGSKEGRDNPTNPDL